MFGWITWGRVGSLGGKCSTVDWEGRRVMLASRLSKWFYDTSVGAATGAAHCVSFIGNGFSLLVISYWWTQCIWRFMWFGPSEHNTLRPRENWVVLLKPALPVWAWNFFPTPVKWCLPEHFIAQGQAVTMSSDAQQVVSGQVKPYVVGHNC
jgi:hypothetical protein